MTRLLFVEDDPDDVDLLRESLEENGITDFLILESGAKAFAYLDALPDNALPRLLIVDLNMPVMSGFEVISRIKASPRYRHIPVYILTTSQRSAFIEDALRNGASGYYQKPASVLELHTLVQHLHKMMS